MREAWLNPDRKIKTLYITDQALPGFEQTLRESKGLDRPNPSIIDKAQLEKMLPRDAVHQGIALDCAPLPETDVQDMIVRAAEGQSLLLMLDQVTDPHNVGATLRSASALGADGVIMQRKHAPDLTGVLAKTACGAVDHIPVAYETNLNRTLETLKEAGFFAFGLDERGEKNIGDINKPEKTVLVLGAEGAGLRRMVAEHCDELVKLPTQGAILSLNVSNAAAVALYAFMKDGQ